MISWAHDAPAMAAAFLGSSVEAIEALTIVLAAGIVRGWRPALLGAGAAVLVLAAIIAVFGPALAAIPVNWLQLAIGVLLLLFGLRWLRKAMLRSAGIIPLHDEDAAYRSHTGALSRDTSGSRRWDPVAFVAAFKAVLLEGIEVVVIVLGVGAVGGMLVPASIGALSACLLVVAAGVIVHRPLARVPENSLKLCVGIIMAAFGLYWFGEGLGLKWPFADAAIIGLAGILSATAWLGIRFVREPIERLEATPKEIS